MSYETGWYNRPYIGYVIFRDVITLKDIAGANTELLTMLNDSSDPMHLLVKVDHLQRLDFKMSDMRKLTPLLNVAAHDKLGEIIKYNEGSELFVDLYTLLRDEHQASGSREVAGV